MVDRLAAVLAVIHHDAEAVLEPLGRRNLASDQHQVAKQLGGMCLGCADQETVTNLLVFILGLAQLDVGLLGQDQEVNGGLRGDVVEGDALCERDSSLYDHPAGKQGRPRR